MDYTEKLRNCFDEMVVYKDLKKNKLLFSIKSPRFHERLVAEEI